MHSNTARNAPLSCLAVLAITAALVACVGDDPQASSSGGSSGSSSGASGSCNLTSGKGWEADCASSAECGGVMTCTAACPSCSDRCQVSCTSDSDCSDVGAGTCKAASCSDCNSVCSRAPTKCPGSKSSSSTTSGGTSGTSGTPSSSGSSGTTSGSSGASGSSGTTTTCGRYSDPYDKACAFNGLPPHYYDCKATDTPPAGCVHVTQTEFKTGDGGSIACTGGSGNAGCNCCP